MNIKSIGDIITGDRPKRRKTARQAIVEMFLNELNSSIDLNNKNRKTAARAFFTYPRFNYLFPPSRIADEELHSFLGECRDARNFEALFRWKVKYGTKENQKRLSPPK